MLRTIAETILMEGGLVWGHIRVLSNNRNTIEVEAQPRGQTDWKPVAAFTSVAGRLAFQIVRDETPIENGFVDVPKSGG